jgi:cytidylate kinase
MAIITISRGTMSGGEALAKALGEQLKYPHVGREILVEAAERLGVAEETLIQKVQKGPGIWERLSSNRRVYVTAVQAALAEHAATGDLVYHGHAGHLLLRSIPSVMRVRLIAPLAMRVKAVMERQHMGSDAAIEYIENVDADRIRWTKFIYGEDWRDPVLYDMVINLEKMSLETACALVAQGCKRPEFTVDASVKKTLADFLLSCRVKVALVTNVETKAVDFEVKATDGTVEVSGEMPTAGMLTHASARGDAEVIRIVESVQGVKKAMLNIRKVDAYH